MVFQRMYILVQPFLSTYESDRTLLIYRFWKDTCDRHDTSLYPEYKAWCDKYFWIPARKEHRGIGGIFFE